MLLNRCRGHDFGPSRQQIVENGQAALISIRSPAGRTSRGQGAALIIVVVFAGLAAKNWYLPS